MVLQDRQGSNLNRKKIKIISQAGDEIIANIERADSPTVEGTKLNAGIMNQFQKEIDSIFIKNLKSFTMKLYVYSVKRMV